MIMQASEKVGNIQTLAAKLGYKRQLVSPVGLHYPAAMSSGCICLCFPLTCFSPYTGGLSNCGSPEQTCALQGGSIYLVIFPVARI